MNQTVIIGNLTRDPELKTVSTQKGDVSVCTFTVAVNNRRRGSNEQNDATFFRVTAWRALGENCVKYLNQGKKVMVAGSVSARAFTNKNGEASCSLELLAEDIEFLSPADQTRNSTFAQNNGMTPVEMGDENLPF